MCIFIFHFLFAFSLFTYTGFLHVHFFSQFAPLLSHHNSLFFYFFFLFFFRFFRSPSWFVLSNFFVGRIIHFIFVDKRREKAAKKSHVIFLEFYWRKAGHAHHLFSFIFKLCQHLYMSATSYTYMPVIYIWIYSFFFALSYKVA